MAIELPGGSHVVTLQDLLRHSPAPDVQGATGFILPGNPPKLITVGGCSNVEILARDIYQGLVFQCLSAPGEYDTGIERTIDKETLAQAADTAINAAIVFKEVLARKFSQREDNSCPLPRVGTGG